MIIRYALASAAALTLAACGGGNDADAPADDTLATADASDGMSESGTPQGFVDRAASSGMYEIEAGRLAQENGSSRQVKDFGAMMVEEHTASSEKLSEAVIAGGAPLAVPPQMLPEHQQLLNALRDAGDDFDRVYLEQQVAAHERTLELLRGQAGSGEVDALREFAAEAAPVVEGHLEQARELAGAAGGAA